jgi:site-specific recombinase XerD
LELIARLAGHSNINTTDGYAHTSNETLANAVAVLNEKQDTPKEPA